jgi:hypothetical protein
LFPLYGGSGSLEPEGAAFAKAAKDAIFGVKK